MKYTLEVCVDSIESAVAASTSGADRIELCCSLETGGLTPSHGLIKEVCKHCIQNCKIYVLVRPRSGDFIYSEDEIEVIKADVVQIAANGAHGVVAGFLAPDGTIDTHRTTKIVDLCTALNLDFTFHRAFDVIKDQRTALNSLIDSGVKRVLTSGGHPKCFHALDELASLVKQAEGRISIMPGGGVDEENAATILQVTGATEIHGSFSIMKPSRMQFLHPRVHFSSSSGSERSSRRNVSRDLGTAANATVDVDQSGNQEGTAGEDVEYTQEELVELWGRRVASEEKIEKVKAALTALTARTTDEEQELPMD